MTEPDDPRHRSHERAVERFIHHGNGLSWRSPLEQQQGDVVGVVVIVEGRMWRGGDHADESPVFRDVGSEEDFQRYAPVDAVSGGENHTRRNESSRAYGEEFFFTPHPTKSDGDHRAITLVERSLGNPSWCGRGTGRRGSVAAGGQRATAHNHQRRAQLGGLPDSEHIGYQRSIPTMAG